MMMIPSPDGDPADALDELRNDASADGPDESPVSATLQAAVPSADIADLVEQQTDAWGHGSRAVVEPGLEADPADAAEQAAELPEINEEDEHEQDQDRAGPRF